MEQRIEFGATDDGKHVVMRVSCGPITQTTAIPVERCAAVGAALAIATRKVAGKVIVPGASGVDWSESTPLASSEEPSEQETAEG